MDVSRTGDLLMIRMYPEEEIVSSLVDACRAHDISTAVVLSSIGQLRDFVLGYFVEKGNYEPREFKEIHELISISGMINRTSSGFESHLHACLGNRSKEAISGHLISGIVSITNETALLISEAVVDRSDDPINDLRGLVLS